MIKYFNPGLLLVLLVLFVQNITAQIPADKKETITRNFIKYCSEVPRQEIFVHTDRADYIAGEDMWFSIYLFNRSTNRLQTDDKLAYIEVLNWENRPVVQKRILLDKGTGSGQVSLPDSLSSGSYTIRAYTNWMKNFMPLNCYMEDIKIYNAFRSGTFMNKSYTEKESVERTVNKLTTVLSTDNLELEVDNFIEETVGITVKTSNRYRSENAGIFYLFIQTRGIINYSGTEKAISDQTVLNIPKVLLSPGINQITVFDAGGHPLKERLIYTPEKSEKQVVLTSSSSFKTREKTTIGLELGEGVTRLPSNAMVSISVMPAEDGAKKINLTDYMLFGSEFGTEPLELLRARSLAEISYSGTDSMLMTLKSNWINWEKIMSGEIPGIKYKPETEYHYLSGRLIPKNSSISDSGKYVYMSTPGKTARFQYAKTDAEAVFNLKVLIDDRIKDIVIQPGDPDNIASTKIESPFSEKYLPTLPYITKETTGIASSLVSRLSTNYQVSKIYETTTLGQAKVQTYVLQNKARRFYGKPDVSLIMDDYIKLPVMEEVFFELIAGATLKKRRTGYEITIYDPVDNRVYDVPPCLMIDGVIVQNPAVIAGIDPELIETIDLVRDKYYIGDKLFFGIINLISIAGDFSSVTLPDYATRLQYKVYEPAFSFVSPDYSSFDKKLSRVPDFRNTLYWNPLIVPDKDGKAKIDFWTSDLKSNYIINLQGVSPDGRMISFKSVIQVE